MIDDAHSETAELLTRMRAAEPDVGLRLYDRFADRIHDFVLFVTRDGGLAAQTTQDVIVMTARQAPGRLTDPTALRAWLYARARDEVFAVLSTRGRTPAEDRVVEVPDLPDHPTAADMATLVWSAMAAFSERDQALVALHLRHGLDDDALAEAMGLSTSAVEVLLAPTLERVESQTAALLALSTGRLPEECDGLQDLHESWDGMFSPMVRGRVSQMLQDAEGPADDSPGPLALLQTLPLVPAPASLRDAVAERLALSSALGGPVGAPEITSDHTIPPPPGAPDDDVTVPPSTAVPVPAAGAPAVAEVVPPPSPAPAAAGTPLADAQTAVTPIADTQTAVTSPAVTSPSGEIPQVRPPKLPLPLALALGIAVGLVIAAGLLRFLTGGETPIAAPAAAPSEVPADALTEPMAGAAGGGLEALAPGRLSVTADEVVVGEDGASLPLANVGGAEVAWRVTAAPPWVVLDQREGTVVPGATGEVTAALADGLAEGDYEGVLSIAWGGADPGTADVRLVGAVEHRPDLQNLQVGARDLQATGCGLDQTEMAVGVADESEVMAVSVTVSGPGSEDRVLFSLLPDATQPGRFVGVVGPFDLPGTLRVQIAAEDARGNRAEADGGVLAVTGC